MQMMRTSRQLALGASSARAGAAAAVRAPLMLLQRQRGVAGGVLCRSAAAGGAAFDNDPYKVLGIEPDADTNAINRAYTQKKFHARGDDLATARIEAAHSRLMMGSLSARLKGQGVARDVRFADREPLFPWRPKRWDATPKVIAIVGVMQLAMAAFAVQSPNMSKVIGAMLIGIAGNVIKQNAISPPPKDPSMATEEEAGRAGRNFVRSALLGLMATFAGVLLFSAPELAARYAGAALPDALKAPGVQVSLKCAGAALANWIITAFYY